jgi:hypothetical protein
MRHFFWCRIWTMPPFFFLLAYGRNFWV